MTLPTEFLKNLLIGPKVITWHTDEWTDGQSGDFTSLIFLLGNGLITKLTIHTVLSLNLSENLIKIPSF
jgi:hypothetical protein